MPRTAPLWRGQGLTAPGSAPGCSRCTGCSPSTPQSPPASAWPPPARIALLACPPGQLLAGHESRRAACQRRELPSARLRFFQNVPRRVTTRKLGTGRRAPGDGARRRASSPSRRHNCARPAHAFAQMGQARRRIALPTSFERGSGLGARSGPPRHPGLGTGRWGPRARDAPPRPCGATRTPGPHTTLPLPTLYRKSG